jgi:putative endonuclease
MSQWTLYLIRQNNGDLYTGITTDIERRFAEHQAGGKKAARYLRGKGPLQLVFSRQIGSRSAALQVEAAVKKLSKPAKEQLVAGSLTLEEILTRAE